MGLLGFVSRLVRPRNRRLLAVALLAGLGIQPAAADICSDLRAQLAAESGARGSSPAYDRYARAARKQLGEIRKVQKAQQAAGCFRNPSARCQALNKTLWEMSANLDELERARDRAAPRGNKARVRAIERRLNANGCGERGRVVRVEPQERRSTNRARVIVREGVGQRRESQNSFDDKRRIVVPPLGGTFRTMCVRTCDGYYFPMSFATTPEFFDRDEQACRAMCPATETRLYSHRVPEEESEAMVSREGEPYTALPTAFLYRKRGQSADPSCTCGTPLNTAAAPAGGNQEPETETEKIAVIPVPGKKPDVLGDPESQMNAETGLTKQAVREMAGKVSQGEVRANAGDRDVRVVGPQFLPDPEEAIDLRSPGRPTGQ